MAYIAVNGTRLWVEIDGEDEKPAVIFSHSLFFDSRMFAHQAAAFSGAYRVIRYDHRGQGRSDPAPRAQQDMDQLAADAAALIEALGAQGCHFVGNSLGGFVALRLAARRPDLVASVAVLGSSGAAEGKIEAFAPLVDMMRVQGPAAHIDTLMFIMFGDSYLADPARAVERGFWRTHMSTLPVRIADSAHEVVFRAPILDELSGTTIPILAVAGGEDHAYGQAEADAVARAAGGRAVVVANAGHSVALEAPAAVNALLAAFWAEAAQRKAA